MEGLSHKSCDRTNYDSADEVTSTLAPVQTTQPVSTNSSQPYRLSSSPSPVIANSQSTPHETSRMSLPPTSRLFLEVGASSLHSIASPQSTMGNTAIAEQSSSSNPTSSSKATSKTSPSLPSYLKQSNGRLTYLTMAFEAIRTIGDRTGSSVPAIVKYMKANFSHLKNTHPNTFRTSLANALKTGVKEKQLIKIKASFKINPEWVKKEKAKIRQRENEKKAKERKRKKEIEKMKIEARKKEIESKKIEMKRTQLENIKKANEMEVEVFEIVSEARKLEIERERLAKKKAEKRKEEAEKKKLEEQAKAKELAERIRKRKFPMDDLDLIAEDKALGVKCPETVTKRPYLPYALSSVVPHDERPNSKRLTPYSVVNMCTTNISAGNRGLISDMLQVYHFFCGDVGYNRLFPLAPMFSLKHMMYSVNEIVVGNAKRAQTLPPLIIHLFVVILRLVTSVKDSTTEEIIEENDSRKHLKEDLKKLNDCLSEVSWGEITFCYSDLMEKFYTSDASNDTNALPGYRIVLDDGDGHDEMDILATGEPSDMSSTDGYYGYLGRADGVLRKAYTKLSRNDPWNLTADEVMALLRAMTDDVIGMDDDLSRNIAERDEELLELLKAKKAAEWQFKKVRLAYEGPKHQNRSKVKKSPETSKEIGNGEVSGNILSEKPCEEPILQAKEKSENDKDQEEEKKKFKPTATKTQFDAAEKARTKAINAYEKGLKKLVSRTESIGYDKNHNAVYFFHHDPEALYIEVERSKVGIVGTVKSWHIIDGKSMFEEFESSLDLRGIRESKLYEALAGGQGSSGLKRYLPDDNKKKNMLIARKKEEETFSRRLENAKIACAAEEAGGRRSGRLASGAKDELLKIQEEMQVAAQMFEIESKPEIVDHHSLTGLHLLRDFESTADGCHCSILWNDDKDTEKGIIGVLVSKVLYLESLCNGISAWDDKDKSRKSWISAIRDTTKEWERNNTYQLGPSADEDTCYSDGKSFEQNQRKSRKLRTNGPGSTACIPSLSQILLQLKNPLIDLEKRIFSLSGIERSLQEADEESENMSVISSASNEISTEERASKKAERLQQAWKKKIFSLNSISPKRAAAVREVLISAVAIARKGEFSDILQDLRSALTLLRPAAGGRARTLALNLLEKHGGYEKGVSIEDEESDSDDDMTDAESLSEKVDSSSNIVSFLSPEAMMLTGSLEGDDHANRVDWKNAVMQCKTISRLAALAEGLICRSKPQLLKMAADKERLEKAIEYWQSSGRTRGNRRAKASHKKKEKFNSSTEIWAEIKTTERFVMAKVEGYPWWPARICIAKDLWIASSMKQLERVLISFVGEPHLHVIRETDEMESFTGETVEADLDKFSTDTIDRLKKTIDMTRRILRGKGKWEGLSVTQGQNETSGEEEEEKKSAA